MLTQTFFQAVSRTWGRLTRSAHWSVLNAVAAFVVLMGILLFMTEGLSSIAFIALLGIPCGLLLLFNPEYVLLAAVFSLYLNVDVVYVKIVVWSSFATLLAYGVNAAPGHGAAVRNPIRFSFYILLASIVPSFYNTVNLNMSSIALVNLLSMTVMAIVVNKLAQEYSTIIKVGFVFLASAMLNGAYLIYISTTMSRRAYGFSGVVYVDYVCIAIIVTVTLILVFRRRFFIPLASAVLFFIAALIFTQTRNTIISLALSLGFFFIVIYKNSGRFRINRRNLIITTSVVVVLLIVGIGLLLAFAPQAFERVLDLSKAETMEVRNEGDFARSSMVTRLLIWHTALNAFIAHPVIGIGLYAFPFDSKYYFTIPPALYKLFVKGLSPHQTFITILAETGILGFIGFSVFLTALFSMAFKAFRLSVTDEQQYVSLGLLVVQIYILCSMVLTDAWLWGQCGLLWSIVIGLSMGNYTIVMRSRGDDVQR